MSGSLRSHRLRGPHRPCSPAANSCGRIVPVWELPDYGNNFINFYTRTDVLDLKDWAKTTRQRRNEERYVVEKPLLPQNFIAFLIEYRGTQWEVKFLRAAAKPLFAQMLAYIAGYARLTSHSKRIFRQWFGTWSAEVKR